MRSGRVTWPTSANNTLCNYGVVYTRIQSIGKEKRKRRREKELCTYIGAERKAVKHGRRLVRARPWQWVASSSGLLVSEKASRNTKICSWWEKQLDSLYIEALPIGYLMCGKTREPSSTGASGSNNSCLPPHNVVSLFIGINIVGEHRILR